MYILCVQIYSIFSSLWAHSAKSQKRLGGISYHLFKKGIWIMTWKTILLITKKRKSSLNHDRLNSQYLIIGLDYWMGRNPSHITFLIIRQKFIATTLERDEQIQNTKIPWLDIVTSSSEWQYLTWNALGRLDKGNWGQHIETERR